MSKHKLTPAEEAAYRDLARAAKRLRDAQTRAQNKTDKQPRHRDRCAAVVTKGGQP